MNTAHFGSQGRIWRLVDRLRTSTPTAAVVGLGSVVLVLVSLIDLATGPSVQVLTPYLLPVMLVAWGAGGRWGALFSLIAAMVSFAISIVGTDDSVAADVVNGGFRLATYVVVVWLLVQIRELLSEKERLAAVDGLTGALSRQGFLDRAAIELERADRGHQPVAVLFVDVDGLKATNDQLGHAAGDAVLCRLCDLARGQLRTADLLGRLGGDEFGLLLVETDAKGGAAVADRLIKALESEATEPSVTLSIGVVGGIPVDADVTALLARADALMYEAKQQGGGASRRGSLHRSAS